MNIQASADDMGQAFLAVICALPVETDALISHHGISSRRVNVKNRRVYMVETPHTSHSVGIFTSGMGKVRAAAETQFAIDRFKPRYLVNFGSAGGVNPERNIGDIVIGEKYVEYDFQMFGDKIPFLTPDFNMIEVARKLPEALTGVVATADQNGDTPNKKSVLWDKYRAECCDWEGAAVVKTAALNRVPALAFRCISDVGCDDVYSEYKKNYKKALKKSAPVFWNFVSLLTAEE
jgi:adenosylhomocysteine nucleosidase